MTPDAILERLFPLVRDRFGDRGPLSADQDFFEALGIDSLQALALLSDLERAFDVEIPDYELQDVRTFAGLAEVIGDRL